MEPAWAYPVPRFTASWDKFPHGRNFGWQWLPRLHNLCFHILRHSLLHNFRVASVFGTLLTSCLSLSFPRLARLAQHQGIEQEEYYQNCSLGFRLQVLYSLTHPERVTVAVVAVVTATGVVVAFLVVVAGGSSRTVVVAVVETIITSRKAKRIRNNWVLVKELNLSYHNKEIR